MVCLLLIAYIKLPDSLFFKQLNVFTKLIAVMSSSIFSYLFMMIVILMDEFVILMRIIVLLMPINVLRMAKLVVRMRKIVVLMPIIVLRVDNLAALLRIRITFVAIARQIVSL